MFPKPADRLGDDAVVLYNLGLLYAESRQYTAALKHARGALSVSEGSLAPAWALVALILSGRYDPYFPSITMACISPGCTEDTAETWSMGILQYSHFMRILYITLFDVLHHMWKGTVAF